MGRFSQGTLCALALLLTAGCNQQGPQAQGNAAGTPSPGTATQPDAGTNGPSGAAPGSPGGTPSPNPTGPTYLTGIKAIIDTNCVPCHGAPPNQGAPSTFRLDTYDDTSGLSGIKTMAPLMGQELTSLKMPPTNTLTTDQRQTLLAWIAAGVPYSPPASPSSPPGAPSSDPMSPHAATPTPPALPAPAIPASLTPVADSSLTYYKDTQALFSAHCITCHGSTPSGGAPTGFRLDSYTDVGVTFGIQSEIEDISVQVANRFMPQTGTMTDDDRQTLLNWIAGGAVVGTPPPTAGFSAPADGTQPAVSSGSYAVTVAFTDAPSGSTYDLYYTTTSGATSGGTAIATAVPVATTTQNLTTSSLANGTYFFYVVLHYGTDTLSAAASGSISVQNNTAPTVSLAAAFANADNSTGVITLPATVSFTAADSDNDTLTYNLFYSVDNQNWTALGSPNQTYDGSTFFSWASLPTEGEGLTYYVRVVVTDSHSASATATSAHPFALAGQSYTFAGSHPVKALLQQYCGSCHGPGGSEQGVWDYSNLNSVTAMSTNIIGQAQGGSMPPTGPLSASDQAALLIPFQLWIMQGEAP